VPVEGLIGTSQAARYLEQEIDDAARSDAKELLPRESGDGKEVVARLIHQQSRRRNVKLVALNCAAVPDSLLESELFGHVRGSFTGAYRDKPGLLELANSGTIFLDEIGETSLRMQALMLRFLENGEIWRIGADRVQTRTDVRVIAATNRDLADRIAQREFRADLYYRLNVLHIKIPPLRDRREDIPLFLDFFFRHYSDQHLTPLPELTPDAHAALVAYDWPGNVRELKNLVERLSCAGAPVPSANRTCPRKCSASRIGACRPSRAKWLPCAAAPTSSTTRWSSKGSPSGPRSIRSSPPVT
jgi:transcriptional regulator with PAS, ATPase and Fis domain